jgi:hypothetical protein
LKTRFLFLALLTALGIAVAGLSGTASVASTRTTAPAVQWSKAIRVPGMTHLNRGDREEVRSVSCAPTGACAAAGSYADHRQRNQGFVVTERDGRWANARPVPGLQALNRGGDAEASVVSCGAAGVCAAGGYYTDKRGERAFVVLAKNGHWGKAAPVRGTAELASVDTVTCGAAGACVAGGSYMDKSGAIQPFVVSELHGKWGRAIRVPGTAVLNSGHYGNAGAIACLGPGTCAAGGLVEDAAGHEDAFVASETDGHWAQAVEVPGTPDPGDPEDRFVADVASVSCATGSCTAGGSLRGASGNLEAFVMSETGGTWSDVVQIPGTEGGDAAVDSLSCFAAGCVAVGYYDDGSGTKEFVSTETSGVWSAATIEALDTSALGSQADLFEFSCISVDACVAGGDYGNGAVLRPFVGDETDGQWSKPIPVPGMAKLNSAGFGDLESLSCGGGVCAAGGFAEKGYAEGTSHMRAFVVLGTVAE